jgi:hypothetical protein
MEPVIKVLQKFKKEQDKLKANSDENAALDSKVLLLEDKIQNLEKTLGKVVLLGKDMRAALRKNKDPADVLDHFAEDLIALASSNSSSKSTPLKSRQATPVKGSGLFGRRSMKATKSK